MAPTRSSSDVVREQAAARVVEVARSLGTRLTDLADALHAEIAEAIPELRGDPLILELLRASTEANVESFVHVTQHGLEIAEIPPPPAAIGYAQRLAQRGISSNALTRAYRLGQRRITFLAFAEIGAQEPDLRVAYAAAERLNELAFAYIDHVGEQVVAAYEQERERWEASRNTVRSAMLAALLAGQDADMPVAEAALGYRLRQNHLAAVVWDADRGSSTTSLRSLESLITGIAEAVGAVGQPLFIPQDRSRGWAWIPLGRYSGEIDLSAIRELTAKTEGRLKVALGSVGAALPGFRSSHTEALRAQSVASIAQERADDVTTYDEPGVRSAALLAGDLDSTRDLVALALGGLAADDPGIERLRETLLEFLTEGGSYLSTAERIHVHKNTVKYRVDKAVQLRGRPVDQDRFNLELALVACRWLGTAVLPG